MDEAYESNKINLIEFQEGKETAKPKDIVIVYLFYSLLIVRIIFMLGKIYEGDTLTIIHNTITKTSNSGLFANKRLAIFSTKDAILGYQSKVPQIDQLDFNCIKQCKEAIHIKSLTNFSYSIKP